MFKRVLVPVDGSPLSLRALPYAAELARACGAALRLLYVVPEPLALVYAEGGAYAYDVPAQRDRLRAEGAALLTEARHGADLDAAEAACVDAGARTVADAIVDEVARSDTDLIVMSTHGRSGLAHLFLGSVAEAVLRRAPVPVLLVREPRQEVKTAAPGVPATSGVNG